MTASCASAATLISGAGATMPVPLYKKMFSEYQKATGVSVDYIGIGSGKGQKALVARQNDFGASDVPMSAEALAAAPGKILHIPTAIVVLVPVYTIPNLTQQLKLDGATLARMYLGSIKMWNDPAIVALNPGVKLPALEISVVYRADGSGSSYVLSDYLSKVSPEWKGKIGVSGSPKFPVGIGAQGGDEVLLKLKTTPGALGYLEFTTANANKLPYAALKNQAGKFVTASNEGGEAAAGEGKITLDRQESITNSANPAAYPISSFTYLLVYQEQKYEKRTPEEAAALKKLLTWMVTSGQSYNQALEFGKLPDSVVAQAKAVIASMTYGGAKF